MSDNTPSQQQTIDIRLFWFQPDSRGGSFNSALLDELQRGLIKAVNDGWEVVARTPAGHGVLYELRRVNGGAE